VFCLPSISTVCSLPPPFWTSVECCPRPCASPCSSPTTLPSTRATPAIAAAVVPPVNPPHKPPPAPHRSPPSHTRGTPTVADPSSLALPPPSLLCPQRVGAQPVPPSRHSRAHLHPDAGHLHHALLPILRHDPLQIHCRWTPMVDYIIDVADPLQWQSEVLGGGRR
jgi:hypothetical protein